MTFWFISGSSDSSLCLLYQDADLGGTKAYDLTDPDLDPNAYSGPQHCYIDSVLLIMIIISVPRADDNRIGPCRVQQQRGSRDHQYQ